MNAPLPKGWCPTLLTPMESGDGLLVRVKPTAARLTSGAARSIAEAAARWGNGLIDLTNRANLQVRGLTAETVEAFATVAAAESLVAADPSVEAVRNVLADPLGPDDPDATFDSHALARDLEVMISDDPRLTRLPGKFGISVDGGGNLSLAECQADIALRADGDGLAVILGGGGEAAKIAADDVVGAVHRLMHAFLDLNVSCGARRMRDLVAAVGASTVFAESGLSSAPLAEERRGERTQPIGGISLSNGAAAFGVGAPFGQIEASALGGVAELADKFGDGTVRVTPWKAVLLTDVNSARIEELGARADLLGLIIAPGDPRRSIVACAGMPACASASVDARGDAARLAEQGVAADTLIHVSGCAKGCAHPYPADLTLVGDAGLYAFVRNGRACDEPHVPGLSPEAAILCTVAFARRSGR